MKRKMQKWIADRTSKDYSVIMSLTFGPLREHAGLFFIALALALATVSLTLVQAGALRLVFNGLALHRWAMTQRGVIVFAVALVATAAGSGSSTYLQNLCGARVAAAVRRRTVHGLLFTTMSFHDQYLVGDLASRLSRDIGVVATMIATDFFTVVINPILIVASATYLWTMSPTLAVVILPVGPVLLIAQRLWKQPIYDRAMAVRVQDGCANHSALEMLRGITQVKAFQVESSMADRYRSGVQALHAALRSWYGAEAQLTGVTNGFGAIPFLAVVVVGGNFVAGGRLELGTLVAAIQLMNRMVRPFSSISQSVSNIQSGRAAVERIQAVATAPIEVFDGAPAQARASHQPPRIVCQDLWFGYGGTPVLRGLSLSADAGALTALMGPNGGGKTTLTKLWLGFYPPERGQMTWDAHRWDTLGTAWIRAHTTYVPQEVFLIQGTVADNLELALPGADRSALRQVLNRVQLPSDDGFLDRAVGDAGRELSGGQRLRLAIARALLRDRPFWILDEPTAALDPDGIGAVAQLIRDLAGQRTVVVITHSQELAGMADRVWMVENGIAKPR